MRDLGGGKHVVGVSVVLLAVGSATAYAVAANLKHASARQVSDAPGPSRRSITRFVRATVTHRLWLLSVAVDLAGAGLQILALRRGALAVVQPLLVSGLVIALVLRARSGGRVRRAEVVWGAVLTAALGAFLVVAGVTHGGATSVAVRPATVMGVMGLLVAGSAVVVGWRRRGRAGAAAVLGVAVGVINASTAVMLKSLTTVVLHGFVAVISSWQLYTLIVLVAAALFLTQLAFRSGPLSASLPTISAVDPLASVVIGVFVFDETMRHGPAAVTTLILLLGVLAAAVAALSRSSAMQPAA